MAWLDGIKTKLGEFKGTHNSFAGVTEGAGNAAGAVTKGAAKIVAAPVVASAAIVGKSAKIVGNAAGHTAAAGTGLAAGFFRTKFGKVAGIGALALAAIGTAGLVAGKSRGNAKKAEAEAELAAISSPAELASGPADGMTPNQWQQNVAASRGTGAPAR